MKRKLLLAPIALALLIVGATALPPSVAPHAEAAPPVAVPLHTDGARIVDREGREVILQGVNWFGFETSAQLPHGLWNRDYRDMLSQIADLGYNTIRLPFSLEAVESTTPVDVNTSGGMNAELVGATPLEAMDVIIAEAADQGLLVLLDNHSTTNDSYMHGLWYGLGGYTEDDWVATWEMLAARYADAPNVIGADLKNEPHGEANWGEGGPADWHRAATRAGNAVLAVAPHWLIVVEGIEAPVPGGSLDRHWWGGNLEGVRTTPVELDVANRVVYSPHEYGPGVHAQPWFSDPNMEAILAERWQQGWGYIVEQEIAPLLMGEWGAKNVDTTSLEGRWINQLVDYLAAERISWTYWSWNPNSGDTGGILTDDWTTIHADKQALLDELLAVDAPGNGGGGTTPTTSTSTTTTTSTTTPTTPSTTTTTTTTTPPGPGGLEVRVVGTATWETGYCADVEVTNTGSTPVAWTATVPLRGRVTSAWNIAYEQSDDQLHLRGADWNRMLEPGATTHSAGYCAEK